MTQLASLFCAVLLTFNWGLGFPKNGDPPTGTMPIETLKQHDAAFMGDPNQKTIYLTFDAGYENGNTSVILDTLRDKKVPAAFFIVGHYVENSPDLCRRMAIEGHTVCNHTYHHPDMSKIGDKSAFSKELESLAGKYKEVTGMDMAKIYRPPAGKFSERCLKTAKELGYKTMFWSLAYVDWLQDKQPDHETALSKLTKRIHPGAVVLLHSTSKTNKEILGTLIDKYREMGYTFGRLESIWT